MALTLYQLEAEQSRILNLIEDADGEITPEAGALLDANEIELASKADGYCQLIRHFQVSAEIRENEAKRLRDLSAADDKIADTLKGRLKAAMERMGMKKLDTKLFKLAIQANGGRP